MRSREKGGGKLPGKTKYAGRRPENWAKEHSVLPVGGKGGARLIGRVTWWWGHQ